MMKEKTRQRLGLELIASENFTSRAVMEVNGSCLTNKYSEGLPGKRYYGGNEFIDETERLCQDRALAAFRLPIRRVGRQRAVAVRALPRTSRCTPRCSTRTIASWVWTCPTAGTSRTASSPRRRRSARRSIFFESMPYRLDESTGHHRLRPLEANAMLFRPKLIIAGASAYPRNYDYKRMRDICDKVGAYLMSDMAHISGLVAAEHRGRSRSRTRTSSRRRRTSPSAAPAAG